ncbi:hypothetical protein [Legionella cherrii]|uniref:Transposase n=1 Tax=Legionella cherrii TaxID=28084 RepID=A0ABY6T7Y0_9GAMM|nr:hypothetical protein [Legionella cherrii]VEB37990.1 Uncharacterised protein [Legionella cherrii]
MKAEIIKSKLDLYDQNKGLFRVLKDEPHIKALREFYNSKLQGVHTLSPPLLLELAVILLGKMIGMEIQKAVKFLENLFST